MLPLPLSHQEHTVSTTASLVIAHSDPIKVLWLTAGVPPIVHCKAVRMLCSIASLATAHSHAMAWFSLQGSWSLHTSSFESTVFHSVRNYIFHTTSCAFISGNHMDQSVEDKSRFLLRCFHFLSFGWMDCSRILFFKEMRIEDPSPISKLYKHWI